MLEIISIPSCFVVSAMYKRHQLGPGSDVFPYQMTLVSEVEGRLFIDSTTTIFDTVIHDMDLESCAVMCHDMKSCTHFEHAVGVKECRLII